MPSLVVVSLLLLYLPIRVLRRFSPGFRAAVLFIIIAKTILMVSLHMSVVGRTGIPVILDQSVDAKSYYDFGVAFENYRLIDISFDDLARERGASSHLGYYYANVLAFQLCPTHPMLFLRLCKLLLFHVGLGMLAETWRRQSTERRAIVAYVLLGAVLYQFFYYHFRNLKDDVLLSLFMMLSALVDRRSAEGAEARSQSQVGKSLRHWIVIGVLLWIISTIRFYLAFAIVCALGMHVVTGRGLRPIYRFTLAGAIAVAFLFLTTRAGFELIDYEVGVSTVGSAASNVYGLFKVFVSPLPWQMTNTLLAPGHTVYLLLLPVALVAFFARPRSNLNWKLYVVLLIAAAVGGHMGDFEPRKRYVMYPVFVGWCVTLMPRPRREESLEFEIDRYQRLSSAGSGYT